MYVSDWERLGIGPTRDLIAIKRAYAQRLKLTRPDDDAQAYQALREAYDRAQHWARYVADDEGEEEPAEDQVAPPSADLDARPAAPATEASPPAFADTQADPPMALDLDDEPRIVVEQAREREPDQDPDEALLADLAVEESPEALVDRSYHAWRSGGEAALQRDWPALEAALLRLPLARRAEASARFADLVISVNQLPAVFVQRLQEHFCWLGDFRIDRMIGSARAEALRHALADVCVVPVTDRQVLLHHADVLTLHRLMQWRSRLPAWLHAALAGWPLQRRMIEAGPRLLRAMGVALADQRKLDSAIEVALWWRVLALAAVLVGVCALIMPGTWGDVLSAVVIAVIGSVAALGGMLIVGPKVSGVFNPGAPWLDSLPGRALRVARGSRLGPWLSLAVMSLSALAYAQIDRHDTPFWPWLAGSVMVLVGVAVCWPARPDLGLVASGTWGFIVACLLRVNGSSDEGFWFAFGLAGVLTLLAVLHAEGRWRLKAQRWSWPVAVVLLSQLVRHAGSLGLPAVWAERLWLGGVALLGAVLTLGRVERDGYRSALVPMSLAVGVLLAAGPKGGSGWLVLAWAMSIGVVILMQRGAEWIDRRLFARARPGSLDA